MNKVSFTVDVVSSSDVDMDAIRTALDACLTANTPGDALCNVSKPTVKALSEQGRKVWRARVKGVTAEQAGDAANPPKAKAEA